MKANLLIQAENVSLRRPFVMIVVLGPVCSMSENREDSGF